jgi:hypothetical protein
MFLFFNSIVVKIALEKCDALCHDGMPGTRAVRAGLASWYQQYAPHDTALTLAHGGRGDAGVEAA